MRLSAKEHPGQKIRHAEPCGQPEHLPDLIRAHRWGERPPVPGDLFDQLGEILAVLNSGQPLHGRRGQSVGHLLDDLAAHQAGSAVVHLGKAGGHTGL